MTGRSSSPSGEGADDFAPTLGILIEIDQTIQQHVSSNELNAELIEARKALYTDLGVPFPGIHLRFNKSLASGAYQIFLQEVPITQGVLQPESLYVPEDQEQLEALGINGTAVAEPVDRRPALWVSKSSLSRLQQLGVACMQPSKLLSYHISLVLRKHAREFIGLQETRGLLTKMEKEFGEVVREVQRVVAAQKIAEVLQRLVQEGVSVRNLNGIFQALVEWGGKEKDPVLLVEYVRIALRRYISYRFSGGQNILAAYLIEPKTEETIRKAIRQTSSGSFLALEPAIARNIVNEVKRVMGNSIYLDKPPVILTSMDIRRYTRKLLEIDMPEIAVLSHQELTEEIQVQPLGSIGGG